MIPFMICLIVVATLAAVALMLVADAAQGETQ